MKPLSSLVDGDDTSRAAKALALRNLDRDDLAALASEQVVHVTAAFDTLDLVADTLVDRDSLAHLLLDLAEVKRLAAEVYSTVEKALLAEAGEKSFETVRGRFEVKKVVKRSGWVWDRLVPDLVAYARTDRRFNGEEVEGEGEATARTLRDAIGFAYGKVRELERRGFNADEYATVEDGGYSVKLPGVTR